MKLFLLSLSTICLGVLSAPFCPAEEINPENTTTSTTAHIVGAISSTDSQLYVEEVQRRIKALWSAPQKDRPSKVLTNFKVKQDGTISAARIVKSSSVAVTDNAALEALAKVHLPPLPASCGPETNIDFTFTVNVHYTPYYSLIKQWQERVQKDDSADNHIGLAQAYEQANSFDSAAEEIKKAIAINPSDVYYKQLLDRCQTHIPAHRPDSAAEAKTVASNDWNAFIASGKANANAQRYDKAIEDFSRANFLNPNNTVSYNDRACVYLKLSQYPNAIRDCTKAIALDPHYSLAYFNRALAYSHSDQHEKEIEDLSQAIELAPNEGSYYRGRGTAYAKIKQYQKAIDDYSKAIELDPNDEAAYSNRGAMHIMLMQPELAITDLSKAIDINPNDRDAYQMRAQVYEKQGKHELAEQDFAKNK